ncbi:MULTISPECIES: ABC transporter permease [Gimesia]|jgi:ribose transport system permease protein|uniref:ABC transporter permease n=2 Tax=Gimesia TaxID=1649453 RepID=A0A6I6ANQ9_9PLAN|nr:MULTISPECIES: ABC transporter permease [Gimesia]MBN71840.1 sugar ABC transporter permease [Gimesia sp.]QDT22147.1 Ribose transport system permease protein RbsC [Gimesia chilikensis]QDT86076.1 Ribose transport system permease protein RbsC [Gimesia chilikensis]QGQ26079.1 ABC transporter permease [Gimesia benthica]
MKKILGILILLIVVCGVTAISNENFVSAYNIQNVTRLTSLFGIISIGVAFVIISGGIDLSIGSVICLIGTMLPYLLAKGVPVPLAFLIVGALSICIGLAHGLLITKLKLQPFIVTLCGLLIYRGVARGITEDQTQGFGTAHAGLRYLATGKIDLPFIEGFKLPVPFLIMLGLALLAAFLLNKTIFGRYLKAIGNNEAAARYSGIKTDKVVITAYVICSFLAGIGGILFGLDINSVQPEGIGNFYELYAIAAAVLGGCSIRGGEGTILGVVIGAALMRVLRNSITMLGIPSQLEFAIIGAVILVGVVSDELVKRYAQKRRAIQQARQTSG